MEWILTADSISELIRFRVLALTDSAVGFLCDLFTLNALRPVEGGDLLFYAVD